MPGVVVTTQTRSGPSGPQQAPSGQAFFVGLAERGSTDEPILLRGMADVEAALGGRPAYGNLYDQLKVYFDEGGRQAYVVRLVGPAASKGTLTLQDRAVAPVSTLKVDAASAGSWAGRLKVEVTDSFATDTFRITVYLDDEVVEDITNITSPADAVTKFARSAYVRLTNLGSASAAPSNNPKALVPTVLTAGTDDRNSITTGNYTDALDKFGPGLGDGAVAIPGQTGTAVWNAIIDHCKVNRRIGILAGSLGDSPSTLKTAAAAMDTEFAGLFTPFIMISDGGFGSRTISPEGYVMACRARAHELVGPWRAPGGKIAKANTVLDLFQDFGTTEANDLNSAKVSVIRKIANSIRLYGWRSLSRDEANYSLLKDRDLVNRLVVEAELRLEEYTFEPVDGKRQVLANMHSMLIGLIDPFRQAGALFENYDEDGELVDPGYRVDTGPDINTRFTLANNEIKARLQIRVSATGELVSLTLTKVGITAGL